MHVYRIAKQFDISDWTSRWAGSTGNWHGPFSGMGTRGKCSAWLPCPDDDGLRGPDGFKRYLADDEVCGAISHDQLLEWFGGALDELDDEGYRLLTLEVPSDKVHVLKHQVVFSWTDAVIVHDERIGCDV